MLKSAAVRLRLGGGGGKRHPSAQVLYELDGDGLGYTGRVTLWKDDETRECEHELSVRQSTPLGSVFVTLDCVGHGAWATQSFEGVGITERDLQWAAAWAVQAVKLKHVSMPGACGTGEEAEG